ncbi:MAG TPA: toll/interleukin-1 receptor domain-containing protein, partial [Gammaproteobacteria bacterium]|nr:toll/interleukin-1 receptor domain-containing protein [Gammaproteobacteria bacterium]
MPESYRYKAFLSYSHADATWGRWLHRRLESYVVPKRLVGRETRRGSIPRRLRPVFRDRAELPSDPDLNARVTEALRASELLVVVCSPAAARSRWVDAEVRTFKRLGRDDSILCVIVAGEPGASDQPGRAEDECFCPALRHRVDADGQLTAEWAEPIAADVRPGGDGRRLARLKLVAGILGIDLDELLQRDLHRRNQRLVAVTAGSLAGMALTLLLAVAAYMAREDAERRRQQAEDLLGFLVGDLRESLQPIGRLDLLDKVGNEAMAYFATVRPGDLTDEGLSRQAQVLTQIGEIRMSQLLFDEALASFEEAYRRSAALAERHPDDGRRLYDRGQAEFWVGNVHYRRGQLAEARTWLTRYRDSSLGLLYLDAGRDEWIREVTYGHHNLAALAMESSDLNAAERGFLDEIAVLEKLLERSPDDHDLREALSDTISWLGTIAGHRGELVDAAAHFERSTAERERMIAAEPNNAQRRYWWALGLMLEAEVAAVSDRRDEARMHFDRALTAMEELVSRDPDNLEWSQFVAKLRVGRGELRAAMDELEQAHDDARRARDYLADLVERELTDREARRTLARAYRLLSYLQQRQGEHDAAFESIGRGAELARAVSELAPENDRLFGEFASILVWEGQLQSMAGDADAAGKTLARVISGLRERVAESASPDLLDPWVRALILAGR